MLVYTPLSPEEAKRAVRGDGLPNGELFFVDRPDPGEANEDAVWIVIDLPDAEAAAYEQDSPPELSYREFALPAAVANRFVARRADVAPSE